MVCFLSKLRRNKSTRVSTATITDTVASVVQKAVIATAMLEGRAVERNDAGRCHTGVCARARRGFASRPRDREALLERAFRNANDRTWAGDQALEKARTANRPVPGHRCPSRLTRAERLPRRY